MVVPGAPVAADVVDPVATEAGLSVVDSSRKLRTPLPSWPRTSGSFPAPKTISTTARTRISSGPPIFGIVHSLARRSIGLDLVSVDRFSRRTDRPADRGRAG